MGFPHFHFRLINVHNNDHLDHGIASVPVWRNLFLICKKSKQLLMRLVCSLHQHLIDPFQACLKRCAIACFPAFIGVFLFPCKFLVCFSALHIVLCKIY